MKSLAILLPVVVFLTLGLIIYFAYSNRAKWDHPSAPPPNAAGSRSPMEEHQPSAEPPSSTRTRYSGRVLDPLGQASAAVEIHALDAHTRTDSEGWFEISVPAGEAPPATFRKLGFLPRTQALARSDATESIYRMKYGGVLRARVTDASGAPIAAALVEVAGFGGFADEVLTDDDGCLAITAPEGAVILTLHSDRHADRRFLDVTVTEDAETTRTFVLDTGTTLTFITLAAGAPLRGVRVRVLTEAGDRGEGESDPNGRCIVAGLAPGKATVIVTRGGYQEEIQLRIVGTDPTPPPEALLLRPAPQWDLRVRDHAGRRVPSAWVEVRRKGHELIGGPPGNAALQILAPGRTYGIRVSAPDFASKTLRWRVTDASPKLNVALRRGGRIRGRIVDRYGDPLSEVRVFVRSLAVPEPLLGRDGVTDSDPTGHFVTARLVEGTYRLQLQHPEGQTSVEGRVEEDADTFLGDITLSAR